VDLFDLAELLAEELDELGFNFDIVREGNRILLRIWETTKTEKLDCERLGRMLNDYRYNSQKAPYFSGGMNGVRFKL